MHHRCLARQTIERAIEGQDTGHALKRRASELITHSQQVIAEVRRLSRCRFCHRPLSTGWGVLFHGDELVHALCLPRVGSVPAGHGPTRSGLLPSRPLRLDGWTVLIVEDHADSRDAMRLIVESFGATVTLAPNAWEALAAITDPPPDVILCDIRMPGIDGFTFLERLRRDPKHKRIRVVAVTGLGDPADLRRIRDAGFDGHLIKPVDFDALTALLRSA